MNLNEAVLRLMALLRWVLIFAYLQLLWLLGTLAGLALGGFFPALYAAIFVAKELMKTKVDYTATRRFIKIYKRIFWRANQIGWLSLLAAAICLSNIVFFNQLQANFGWAFFVKMIWFVVTIIVLSTLSLIVPTFIDYQLKFKEFPKLFLIGLGDIRAIFTLIISTVAIYLGFQLLTGYLFFLVLGIYIVMIALVSRSFEQRKIIFDKGNANEKI